MLSNSILYKILPSGNVYTFMVFFRALPERPENLQLAVNDDLIFLKKVFFFKFIFGMFLIIKNKNDNRL